MDTREASDRKYMQMAIDMAWQGEGYVSPNPLVGAVLVRDGRVLGKGWHRQAGDLHAEREALKDAADRQEDPQGATLYVTLEPCCHYGKQPPCTEAIIEAGIRRVVVGSDDPNPKVHGKGFDQLRQAGIEVQTHFMQAECDALNPVFFYYIQEGLPYVTLKTAMTLDGKTATASGDSRWVTSEETRADLRQLRHINKGILVGIGTVLADDPLLTTRLPGLTDPIRIIADSRLRTPLDSQLVTTARQVPCWILTAETDPSRQQAYLDRGVKILTVPKKDGELDLRVAMTRLAQEGIDSLLLEGGATLNGAMLQEGLIQKVVISLAPKLLGGREALPAIGGPGFAQMSQALPVHIDVVYNSGPDLIIEGEVENVHRDR